MLLLLNMVKDYDQNDEKNPLRRIRRASILRFDRLISKKIQLPQIECPNFNLLLSLLVWQKKTRQPPEHLTTWQSCGQVTG